MSRQRHCQEGFVNWEVFTQEFYSCIWNGLLPRIEEGLRRQAGPT